MKSVWIIFVQIHLPSFFAFPGKYLIQQTWKS